MSNYTKIGALPQVLCPNHVVLAILRRDMPLEEEISLRELIEILLKRKNIIIGITLAALIISFLVTFLIQTPEYQAHAYLKMATYQIDREEKVRFLHTQPEDYLPLLKNEEFWDEVASNPDLAAGPNAAALAKMVKVTDEDDNGILKITAAGTNPTEVAQVANTVAAEFINFCSQVQERRLSRAMATRQEHLIAIERELGEILLELEALEDEGRWFGHLEEEAVAYGEEKAQLKLALLDLTTEMTLLKQSEPFTLIRPAATPSAPVSPRRSLNLALSLVLGLMVGTFVAFFLDYWQASDPSRGKGAG